MKQKVFVQPVDLNRSSRYVLLELFSLNEDGHKALITRSASVPKIAAASMRQLLDRPSTVAPSLESLKSVLRTPGRTAWASGTASEAHTAALKACSLHDMEIAQGALVMITLSPHSSFVASIRSVLDVIHRATPFVTARALGVAHDEALDGRVRVDMLLTGV